MTLVYGRIILYLINKEKGECVFTTPIGKRIGAFVLAGAISGSLCACGKIPNENNEISEILLETNDSSIESIDIIDNVSFVENDLSEEVITAAPVVEKEKETEVVTESTNDHVCELYDLLFVNGCNLEDVNRELGNVLLVKLAGTEITAEQRLALFNTLGKTVPVDVDVVEYYYPLAKHVHLGTCSEMEHDEVDGNIVCNDINFKLNNFSPISFEEYIFNKAYNSGSITLKDAVERLRGYGISLSDVLIELDAIYNVCSIPTDFDDETWNLLFNRLLTTTNEYENVCFIYYDLALLVHKAVCRDVHYLNMFGVTECNSMTYKLDNKDL